MTAFVTPYVKKENLGLFILNEENSKDFSMSMNNDLINHVN